MTVPGSASVSEDGSARVWDVATGACKRSCAGHRRSVVAVAWRPDGSHIATAAEDGTGTATGRPHRRVRGSARALAHDIEALAIGRGRPIVVGSDEGLLRLRAPVAPAEAVEMKAHAGAVRPRCGVHQVRTSPASPTIDNC